jgi:hypothetical protein
LPAGWQPEGIATGFGNQFFAGSRATGGIFKGNLKTGKGAVLVPGAAGGAATGMKVDRRNRLFVSGAGTGTASVYRAGSGKLLRRYTLTSDPSFINDVTLTRRAAYFTDSGNRRLYVLELGRHGRLPATSRTLPLTGDLQYDTNPNTLELNGIATVGRHRLITVQSRNCKLFLVNARTGRTREIDLGGDSVVNGDGLLLRRRTLYVVQNRDNKIAVVHPQAGPAARRNQALPDRLGLRRADHARVRGRLPVDGQRPLHHAGDADDHLRRGARQSISLRSTAQRLSSCRFDSCSLRSTADTCASTVFVEIESRWAISL